MGGSLRLTVSSLKIQLINLPCVDVSLKRGVSLLYIHCPRNIPERLNEDTSEHSYSFFHRFEADFPLERICFSG